jgi:hypothetical protein
MSHGQVINENGGQQFEQGTLAFVADCAERRAKKSSTKTVI